MEAISDILLIAGTFGAGIYCYVLAARLRRFSTLETGMGGAIAVLSAQVDDMTRALDKASLVASGAATSLEALNGRAEAAGAKLEILLASLHDLPEPNVSELAGSGSGDRKLRFMRRRSSRHSYEAAE